MRLVQFCLLLSSALTGRVEDNKCVDIILLRTGGDNVLCPVQVTMATTASVGSGRRKRLVAMVIIIGEFPRHFIQCIWCYYIW